jgi:hypothetical protein
VLTVLVGWMVGRTHPDRQRTVLLRRNSTGEFTALPTGTWRTDPGEEIRTATSTWVSTAPSEGLRRAATTWDMEPVGETMRASTLRAGMTWRSEPEREPLLRRPTAASYL